MATLVGLVAIAGCGGGSSGGGSVKSGLLTGIDGLAGADRLTTTIRLDTTPATLRSVAQASGDTLDTRTASAITGADLVIETVRGSSGTAVDIKGVAGGATLLDFRSVNNTLYIQGDVRGILTLINKPKVYANLKAETKSMPSFIQAVVNGRWVSLPAAALSSLSTLTGGQSSAAASSGSKLLGALRRAIDQDVTVTKDGTDSRGTHYVLNANTRALATDARAAVQNAVPGGALLSQRVPTTVKSQNFTFDAWVKDGALSELSINLLQFGDTSKVPSGATLPLTITFDRTGADISAPTGATPVDLTQLGTLFGALTGGGSG